MEKSKYNTSSVKERTIKLNDYDVDKSAIDSVVKKVNQLLNKEDYTHPSYYNQGEIECIDAMISAKGITKVMNWLECNTFKREWRLGHKDEVDDEITKIKWELDKYLELKKKYDEADYVK